MVMPEKQKHGLAILQAVEFGGFALASARIPR
jgi:hypothetical protein